MVCKDYGLSPEKFSQMDHYWDDLGLMAFTHEQKTAYCFGIKLGDTKKYPIEMTKYDFSGTLLINSRPWQEVVGEVGGNRHTFCMKLGKLHANVIRYGHKAKDVKLLQVEIDDCKGFQYFD